MQHQFVIKRGLTSGNGGDHSLRHYSVWTLGLTQHSAERHSNFILYWRQKEREADNASPYSPKVKNSFDFISNAPYVVTVWCLSKDTTVDISPFNCYFTLFTYRVAARSLHARVPTHDRTFLQLYKLFFQQILNTVVTKASCICIFVLLLALIILHALSSSSASSSALGTCCYNHTPVQFCFHPSFML
jgi:hypothetical protein